MGTVTGDPFRLRDYTATTTQAIPQARQSVAAYRTAVRAYNNAEPNMLDADVTDRSGGVSRALDELRSINRVPGAFGSALKKADAQGSGVRSIRDTRAFRALVLTYVSMDAAFTATSSTRRIFHGVKWAQAADRVLAARGQLAAAEKATGKFLPKWAKIAPLSRAEQRRLSLLTRAGNEVKAAERLVDRHRTGFTGAKPIKDRSWRTKYPKTAKAVSYGGRAFGALGVVTNTWSANRAAASGNYGEAALYTGGAVASTVLLAGAVAGGVLAAPAVVGIAAGVAAAATVYSVAKELPKVGKWAKGLFS